MATTSMPNIFTLDMDNAVAFDSDQFGFSQPFRFQPEGRAEHIVLKLGDSQLAALESPRCGGGWA